MNTREISLKVLGGHSGPATEPRAASETDIESSVSDRKFGITFGVIFLLLGFYPMRHGAPVRGWALGLGVGFSLIALGYPQLLTLPNRWWMKFSLLLNAVMTPVWLGVAFFLVLTPMAYWLRWKKKELLRLRWDKDSSSYWIPKAPASDVRESMQRLF